MNNCIFCKIISREIPSDIVYEDAKVIAFMDIRPVSYGHSLVVPKDHHADVLATPDELLQYVIVKAKEVAKAVEKAVDAHGFTLSTNRGVAAGQTVFHLHFHIIPRFDNDGLEPWEHKESEAKSRSQLAAVITKYI